MCGGGLQRKLRWCGPKKSAVGLLSKPWHRAAACFGALTSPMSWACVRLYAKACLDLMAPKPPNRFMSTEHYENSKMRQWETQQSLDLTQVYDDLLIFFFPAMFSWPFPSKTDHNFQIVTDTTNVWPAVYWCISPLLDSWLCFLSSSDFESCFTFKTVMNTNLWPLQLYSDWLLVNISWILSNDHALLCGFATPITVYCLAGEKFSVNI